MSKCWYCNEELTTANYSEEHIGICTKCYRSMYQGNKIVKGWMDKISDLESKLAQSKLNESFEKEKKENAFKFTEELKQQLALTEKALELSCEALNKNIENLCEFCCCQGTNENYGSCECDEQFETERTMDYFKTKAKEMLKSE